MRDSHVRDRSPNAPLSCLLVRLLRLQPLRPRTMLLQSSVPPGIPAATTPRSQTPLPAHGIRPTGTPYAPARLSTAECSGPRDGSWFPSDHHAAMCEPYWPWELYRLRPLQSVDRPVSRNSAALESDKATMSGRQMFKKLRFQMIDNKWSGDSV
jgi:hypothetical protein